MIPYALVWLVYGHFTLGYIACNEAYDDTYRCYNHFYAPMYCTRNQPYADDHPNAVLGNGEGNYFRRCVGVVELLSACMILSTLHVNSNPDGYQGEATLAASTEVAGMGCPPEVSVHPDSQVRVFGNERRLLPRLAR